MKKHLTSAAAFLTGNAAGLLLAAVLLTGFSMTPVAFLIVTLVFSAISVVAQPLITKISEKNLPSLMGGIALVTTFVGLILTNIMVSGFQIGGIANLLAATLLVWLGAVIAGILLQVFVFKPMKDPTQPTDV
jgi:hypothetical protein